jgi:two-component system, OmpR family, phosphate regulon sensor histidine kinase PhoR
MNRITARLKAPKGLALALFLAIVVVAVAQISWWIIFQITISREQEKLYTQVAQNSAALATSMLNHSYDRLISDASALADGSDLGQAKKSFDHLLTDLAVRGYLLSDSAGKTTVQGGVIDSALYYPLTLRGESVLFFNSSYPSQLVGQLNPDLVYRGNDKQGAYVSPWFTASMFTLKPEVLAHVKNKAFHRVVMFVAEGSFFVLLTLFGAFMIYRTLHQSEELKLQQENFIHAVTHEFKIPVASIKLYLETMASQKIDKEKCLSLVPRMLDDCRRLEQLVDNVLEAGRLTRQSHHLKLSPANLSADLAEYLEELQPLIERSRLKLNTDIEPDLRVCSDYQAMRRVISALVDNAIKYSPETRRELTITAKRAGSQCVLAFADRGVGIEPHERRKIFDHFYRTGMESTRSVKGTGLGLFLAKEIVAEHNGSVEVRSDGADCGSTFIITLPLEKQA